MLASSQFLYQTTYNPKEFIMTDFNLDFAEGDAADTVSPQITSKSLCTPGCITGWLMCNEVTKGCPIHL